MATINGVQTIGILMIAGGTLFFILPAIGVTFLLALFGGGVWSTLGLLGLIPGGIMVWIGYYLYINGARKE